MPRLTQLTSWSRDRIRKLVADGMPVHQTPRTRGEEWLFNTADVFDWAMRRTDPRLMANGGGEAVNFDIERARLTREQADKLARERLAEERSTVRTKPIVDALAAQDQAIKDRLLMVPITGSAEALAAGARAGAPGIAEVYERHINRALADLGSAELVTRAAH